MYTDGYVSNWFIQKPNWFIRNSFNIECKTEIVGYDIYMKKEKEKRNIKVN